MSISKPQAEAVRKHSAVTLRQLNITDPEGYDATKLSWRELGQHQDALVRAARVNADRLTDNLNETEVRSLEEAHNGLMAMLDDVEAAKHNRRPITRDGGEGRGQDDGDEDERADAPREAFALRSDESFASRVAGTDARPYRGLSAGSYLRAMVVGPKNDIERRALAEGSDSAGGYTVPDILSASLIDRMRAASVVMKAGAQTVPLFSDVSYIAKIASDPVPAWRAENATVSESDPTFSRVTFTARSLAVIVRVSRELLEDSLNIETALPNVLSTALAGELDRVALLGTGTAPEPRGVANFSGLTASGVAAGDLTNYTPLIKARTALRGANSDVTAYILSARDEGALAGMTDSTGQPINVPPAIVNVPRLATTKIPVNLGSGTDESIILAGDWSRLMIGVRSAIRVEILRERYADVHQYAFVAHLRADVAAEHEAAFTKITGVGLA